MNKDTVILIPSYEPDEELINLVNKLLTFDFKILLINDGSSTKYDAIFDQVKDKVTYLVHPKNEGKGNALKHGFSYLTFNSMDCKYVITCDGDGQHAVEDIIKVDEELHRVNEVVLGVRLFGKGTPRHSITGNNMSRFCRTLVTKDYIQDDQCGLRGFPYKYLNDLISTPGGRYEYEMNIICQFQLKRYPLFEVPIQTIYFDGNKKTHFNRAKDTFRIQRSIWINVIYALISFFLAVGAFFSFNWLNDHFGIEGFSYSWNISISLLIALFFLIAMMSFVLPSKRFDKRLFVECMFALARYVFVSLYFYLGYELCKIHPFIAFCLAIFLATFVNFVLAYFIHKIKFSRIKKRYK